MSSSDFACLINYIDFDVPDQFFAADDMCAL